MTTGIITHIEYVQYVQYVEYAQYENVEYVEYDYVQLTQKHTHTPQRISRGELFIWRRPSLLQDYDYVIDMFQDPVSICSRRTEYRTPGQLGGVINLINRLISHP